MRLATVALAALCTLSASAQDRKKSDNEILPGVAWTFEASKGELSRRGEFRIFEKKVFQGEKNIGTIAEKGDEATLIVKHGALLNGRILIKRDAKDPGPWRGVLQHGDGSTWQIVVRTKEDKPAKKEAPKKGDKPKDKK